MIKYHEWYALPLVLNAEVKDAAVNINGASQNEIASLIADGIALREARRKSILPEGNATSGPSSYPSLRKSDSGGGCLKKTRFEDRFFPYYHFKI